MELDKEMYENKTDNSLRLILWLRPLMITTPLFAAHSTNYFGNIFQDQVSLSIYTNIKTKFSSFRTMNPPTHEPTHRCTHPHTLGIGNNDQLRQQLYTLALSGIKSVLDKHSLFSLRWLSLTTRTQHNKTCHNQRKALLFVLFFMNWLPLVIGFWSLSKSNSSL